MNICREIAYWKCKIFGHKWDKSEPYKQYCKRKNCSVFRTLMADKKTFETSWEIIDFYNTK